MNKSNPIPVRIKYISHLDLYLPELDHQLEEAVERAHGHDLDGLLNHLPRLDGKKVIDVGAYVGDTSRLFVDEGANVEAFEPFFDAFTCLRLNCPDNVNHHWDAVGNGEDVIKLSNEIAPGMRRVEESKSVKDTIKTVCLDKYFFFPDVIKIDVEGFELRVLKGAAETLKKFKPILIIEIFPFFLTKNGDSLDDIMTFLHQVDYRKITRIGDDQVRWNIMAE